MLKNKALYYYKNGYNCSQCIIKACESVYKIPLSKQCINMCSALNNGIGIGSTCDVLMAGIMIFGILFDAQTAKRLRIKFLTEFSEKHSSLSCPNLRKEMGNSCDCCSLIGEIADLIEKTIDENNQQK